MVRTSDLWIASPVSEWQVSFGNLSNLHGRYLVKDNIQFSNKVWLVLDQNQGPVDCCSSFPTHYSVCSITQFHWYSSLPRCYSILKSVKLKPWEQILLILVTCQFLLFCWDPFSPKVHFICQLRQELWTMHMLTPHVMVRWGMKYI